jgi:hypothetical protein
MIAHPTRMNTTSRIVVMNFNQELAGPNRITIGPWTSHAIIELKMQIVIASAADEAKTDLAMMCSGQHAWAMIHDLST